MVLVGLGTGSAFIGTAFLRSGDDFVATEFVAYRERHMLDLRQFTQSVST